MPSENRMMIMAYTLSHTSMRKHGLLRFSELGADIGELRTGCMEMLFTWMRKRYTRIEGTQSSPQLTRPSNTLSVILTCL